MTIPLSQPDYRPGNHEPGNSGWQEVAQTCLDFIRRFV